MALQCAITDVPGLKKRDEWAFGGEPRSARPSRTLLDAAQLATRCQRGHFVPVTALLPYVSVAWTLRWQFDPGEALVQHVLPDPCVQIVVDPAGATVLGVVTRRFSVVLTGARFVLGLKFRPGGFRPFARAAVSTFTNRSTPLGGVFPHVDDEHLRALAHDGDGRGVMDVLESLLCACDPSPDARLDEVYGIVHRIATDATLLTVERATREFGASQRSLQRLLQTYVGVTPKWLIRLHRLKEAAARIEAGDVDDWADFALRLGYADQAHFVNDFRSIVGLSPARYANSVRKR